VKEEEEERTNLVVQDPEPVALLPTLLRVLSISCTETRSSERARESSNGTGLSWWQGTRRGGRGMRGRGRSTETVWMRVGRGWRGHRAGLSEFEKKAVKWGRTRDKREREAKSTLVCSRMRGSEGKRKRTYELKGNDRATQSDQCRRCFVHSPAVFSFSGTALSRRRGKSKLKPGL
jgi:hypothetical protein